MDLYNGFLLELVYQEPIYNNFIQWDFVAKECNLQGIIV